MGVIGHYPQVQFKKGYNPTLPYSHRQVKGNTFPKFSPELELEIDKKAKPTNYLERTSPSFGFLVDKSFKDILEKHNLPAHAFYPIKVYHNNILLDYYWFHFIVDDFWVYLNLEESSGRIHRTGKIDMVKEMVHFESRSQVRAIKKNLGFEYKMRADKLVFNQNFPLYDVYQVKDIEWHDLISERLKMALEEAGMTGFRAIPFDRLYIYGHSEL